MLNRTLIYLSIFLVFFLPLPSISSAQTNSGDGFFQIILTPANPEPDQMVKITLKSYSYDLERSEITWTVNGIVEKGGLGQKEITIFAGKSGEKTNIGAKVTTNNGENMEINTSFIPAGLDLVYEARTYVPPFYKGKAKNVPQGRIVVAAIPNFVKEDKSKVSPANIIFTWKKDGKVVQSASGLGKNSFSYKGVIPLRDVSIQVTASSLSNNLSVTKQINISDSSPKIIFYENNPVYGIMFNQAIKKTINMTGDEFSLVAEPYFFGVEKADSTDLQYIWKMGGKKIENQNPVNTSTVRITKTGVGIANFNLEINNLRDIFQIATNNYVINFDKE